ncbi:MAG: hypothetical protein U9M90_03025 [Patescibacteria group bacterium]|nr:hypothetical protein [Patescibacteria group bacterium]
MKLKRKLFCITDNYNKPDFRCLFENRADAEKKIWKMQGSLKGETVFFSNYKRDFFIDGVKKNTFGTKRQLIVKKGCWTTLKVKKMSLLADVRSETLFDRIKKTKEQSSSLSMQSSYDLPKLSLLSFQRSSFFEFDWQNSFLRTRSFTASCAALFMLTFGTVFAINHNTANQINSIFADAQADQTKMMVVAQTRALENKDGTITRQFDEKLDELVLETLFSFDNLKTEEFEHELYKILAKSPMENMVPLIAQQDRTVAAFLVGIAKKESNFGRRVPVLNDQDCFNYWGYRGIRPRMGSGGHTCFNDPEDAIDTVGGRLGRLVNADVDTPQEMVLWKCGSQCSKDPQAGKWIRDVNLYFKKVQSDGPA